MADLTITPIAISGGINDSASRPEPGDFQTLKNFAVFRGRIGLRAPLVQTVNINDVTLNGILAGAYHGNKFYVVAYDDAGNQARLYELNTDGTSPTFKTNIWTGISVPPAPILASFDGGSATAPVSRLYIADWNQANVTKTWRSLTTLTTEQEDLNDDNTKEDLTFHYVFTYNFHVFGAGLLHTTIVRPELLRATRPGVIAETEPYMVNAGTASKEWWTVDQFPVGVRGEKIFCHGYAGGAAIIFKERRTFALFGYDAQSFAIKQLSDRVGAVGRRAACWTDDGYCFFWSERGLMVTDGQTVTDLSEPIRNRVVSATVSADVALEYSPDDGQVYIAYVKSGDTLPRIQLAFDKVRGKFWEPEYVTGSQPAIGAIMSIPTTVLPGPAAAPSSLAGDAVSDSQIDITWVNGDTALDVTTEIYVDTSTAPTVLYATVGSGVASASITGKPSITTQYIRLRHKRNGTFSGYSNEINKKTWLKAVTAVSAVSLANGVRVTMTNNEASSDLQIERKLSSDSTWTTLTTLTNQTTGVKTHDDTTGSCGSSYDYRVLDKKSGEHDSLYSGTATAIACQTAPDIIGGNFNWNGGSCFDNVGLIWTGTNFTASDTAKIYRNDNGGGFTLIATVPLTDQEYTDTWPWKTGGGSRTLNYKIEAYDEGTTLSDTFTMTQKNLSVQTCPL
jgi:hypothetical protein